MMIWITHNKINGVATDVRRVWADDSRHFIGEVNLISNGFVTMRNHANKLRGHKAVPNNGSYWLGSLDTTNGNNSVMIINIIMGTILFKHRIYWQIRILRRCLPNEKTNGPKKNEKKMCKLSQFMTWSILYQKPNV